MAQTLKLSAEQYHALENVWGNSQLSDLAESPLLFYQRHIIKSLPPAESQAFDFGTAVHLALLEPHKFYGRVAPIPPEVCASDGSKRGKAWERWRDDHEGLILLHQAEVDRIVAMQSNLRRNEALRFLLHAPGPVEKSILWTDGPTGLRRKARPDKIAKSGNQCVVIDVKSTIAPYPEGFQKQLVSFGYHRQAAYYLDGVEAAGMKPTGFVIIAVPKKPGYDPVVFKLAESAIQVGREQNGRLLVELHRRLRLDDWHVDAFDQIHELDLPANAYPPIELIVKGQTVTM